MRRAGIAVTATQGVLVLERESGDPPSIGTAVVDESLDRIGKVVDVIGPVEQPYLVVSPESSAETARLLGEILYIR